MQQARSMDAFIEHWLEFDLQLRERRGLNAHLYEALQHRLLQLKQDHADAPGIPKPLAQLFVDVYGATESSAYLYEGQARQQILEAADRLAALARDVCS